MAFGFLKKIVKGVRKGIGGGINLAAQGVGSVGKLAGKVPVIGGGLKGVFNLTISAPFQLTNSIAKGQRIDKAALSHLKSQVASVKEVAPYAQMVLQAVPGVGQGLSGAISAGLALSSGQPITKALLEGIKGALPGGPICKSAFDIGNAVVAGKSITKVALAGLPLDDKQKDLLLQGLAAASKIAKGQNVAMTAFDSAQALLPPDVRKALTIGIAVAQGQNLQKIAVKHVDVNVVAKLSVHGKALIMANPVLKAGAATLKSGEAAGFKLATAVMSQTQLKPIEIVALRNKLDADGKKGFDIAASVHIGLDERKISPAMVPAQAFGFAATHGMAAAAPKLKEGMIKQIASTPATRGGAVLAIQEVATERAGWWKRMLKYLNLDKKAKPISLQVTHAIKVPPKPTLQPIKKLAKPIQAA